MFLLKDCSKYKIGFDFIWLGLISTSINLLLQIWNKEKQ